MGRTGREPSINLIPPNTIFHDMYHLCISKLWQGHLKPLWENIFEICHELICHYPFIHFWQHNKYAHKYMHCFWSNYQFSWNMSWNENVSVESFTRMWFMGTWFLENHVVYVLYRDGTLIRQGALNRFVNLQNRGRPSMHSCVVCWAELK